MSSQPSQKQQIRDEQRAAAEARAAKYTGMAGTNLLLHSQLTKRLQDMVNIGAMPLSMMQELSALTRFGVAPEGCDYPIPTAEFFIEGKPKWPSK